MSDQDNINDVKEEVGKDIFEAIGAQDLPEDEKGKLLSQMLEIVQTRVLTRIIELLPEEEAQKLNEFAEKDDFDGAEAFIVEKVPNLEQIYKDEADKLRQELIIDSQK